MTLIELARKKTSPQIIKGIVDGLIYKQKNEEILDDLREIMGLPTLTQIAEMKAANPNIKTTMDYDV